MQRDDVPSNAVEHNRPTCALYLQCPNSLHDSRQSRGEDSRPQPYFQQTLHAQLRYKFNLSSESGQQHSPKQSGGSALTLLVQVVLRLNICVISPSKVPPDS